MPPARDLYTAVNYTFPVLESLGVEFGNRARNGATNPEYQEEIAERRERAEEEEIANDLGLTGWEPNSRIRRRQERYLRELLRWEQRQGLNDREVNGREQNDGEDSDGEESDGEYSDGEYSDE